jgi:hypothetical protein
MICSRCPNEAHFDFGAGILLCSTCVTVLLSKCRVSSPSSQGEKRDGRLMAPAPQQSVIATNPELADAVSAGQAAAVIPPTRHEAVAANHDLGIPPFLDRRHPLCAASRAHLADDDKGQKGKRSNTEDRDGNEFEIKHLRNSELVTAGVNRI